MFPKKLDRYIMKKFITTFFVALVLIIGIVIIFDVSEKIDNFVSKQAPLHGIIFDYYLNFVPYFVNMFSPLFVFITVIFFTAMMASNSEIVAILSCGISYRRMMVPYLVSAAIIASMSLYFNLYVIPHSNVERVAFEEQYVKRRADASGRNIHYQINPGEYVYVENFSRWNNTAYKFTLEKIRNNEIISKLSAESAVWDTTKLCWSLRKYTMREYYDGFDDIIKSGAQLDTALSITVDDFKRGKDYIETLDYDQLRNYIAIQRMRGDADVKFSLIELHKRFALPFSAFILTIMGVALSSKKHRGGIGMTLGIGIALAFIYILFLRFSEMFVYTDTLPPEIALWMPNVIYFFIALYLYRGAQK